MLIENGPKNSFVNQDRGESDFIIYSSGRIRPVYGSVYPRSLNSRKPEKLDEEDFIIPKSSWTPHMKRVVESTGGETIIAVLNKVFANGETTLRRAEKDLGVSDSTLHSWKNTFAIDSKRPLNSLKKDTRLLRGVKGYMQEGECPADTLKRLYETASLRELAVLLHVTAPTVESAMRNLGIPRREPHVTIVPK